MPRTLGIMLSSTTYGTWLRGDRRRWISDGVTYPPQPQLEAADRARLRHPPFLFPHGQRHRAGELIGEAVDGLNGKVYALTVCRYHMHVVISYVHIPVPQIVKAIKDAVRKGLGYRRPIWTAGYDKRFCFDRSSLIGRIVYVQKHNIQDGLAPDPWEFIVKPPWFPEKGASGLGA